MVEYKIGDKVIHWNYGLGEVVAIEEKTIREQLTKCFVVQIRDMTIWVSADLAGQNSLRPPTPEGEFDRLFGILQSPAEPLPGDRYERKSVLIDRIKEGSLDGICRIIRDLSYQKHQKKLNDNDKSTLERAENMLLVEWEHSLRVPFAQAQEHLGKLLGP